MQVPKFTVIKHLLLLVFSIALISCGGSGDSTEEDTLAEITGTAATGAALAAKTVSVVDAKGAMVTTTTTSDGKFSVKVSSSAKPFMLKVETSGDPLYSFAANVGTVNISQLTNLALLEANKNGSTYTPLDSLFKAFKDHYAEITSDRLEQAQAIVNATLGSQWAANGLPTTYDFFTTAFDANGAGFDAVLDAVSVTIGSGQTLSDITISIGGSSFGFDPSIDFSNFMPGGSGANSSSCAARTSAYASAEAFFSDIEGDYKVTSITGGGGSQQASAESRAFFEINILSSFLGANGYVSATSCADAAGTSDCRTESGYAASLSSTTKFDLMDSETNIYFAAEAGRSINLFYEHATCNLTVEFRPASPNSPANWAALHHDPDAIDAGNGSTGGGIDGNWDLTITGTAGGIKIPAVVINDFPAAAVPTANSIGDAEKAFNTSFGAVGTVSGFSYDIVSTSSTQVVATIVATVTTASQVVGGITIPGTTISYNLTYTYTKQ